MNYNMKLRLKAEIEDDLAKVIRFKKMHATNAYGIGTVTSDKTIWPQKHHTDMAMVYEDFERTLNHYLLTIEKLDDDVKWMMFHLKNLQDLPNDMVKTSLENIENVLITGNYVKEGD